MIKSNQTIIFGGGCFWCTEAVFKMLKGVVRVESGYAGGSSTSPTYEEVSSGTTGHIEVVRIEFQPEIISLRDLLTVFFATHDPTTPNRQGNDVGSQYRSAVLCADEEQKKTVEEFIREINSSTTAGRPIVTEVKIDRAFYPAEDYHQDYYNRQPFVPYCELVINPKLEKVKEKFSELLKNQHDK